MPASRSRTERWRECLRQVYQRDGALEISIPSTGDGPSARRAPDLIWRVRILDLRETVILVEQPSAAGQWIQISQGCPLIAVLSIGQNRWMFRTSVLKDGESGRCPAHCLRLEMPISVERCQRRNFYRISTAELALPRVECWPLLDPGTVGAAEVANRAQILDLIRSPRPIDPTEEPLVLPEVGPRFGARLMNLGGGGAGVLIEPSNAGAIDRTRLYWLRLDLMPRIPAPLAITARMVHTHIDSAQNIYSGFAFEWAFHPGHRDFVVQQITRYVDQLQSRGAPPA